MSAAANPALRRVHAGPLEIACADLGAPDAPAAVLLHGFPYDVHAYDDVVPILVAAGMRVLVPYLRGFGPTRFIAAETPRSGQQAALAHDLLALLDALQLPAATLAGYDWGGRAACIVAALWPQRVRGLVTGGGYNIQHIASATQPAAPADEFRYWYQFYFHGERGRAGLQQHRRDLCRLLWTLWSPCWGFDDATFERSAAAFDNPDFVAVVIHSYRHRYGLVPGDPAFEATERRLHERPRITVPTVVLDGGADGLPVLSDASTDAEHFGAGLERRVLPSVGHNLPQEAPGPFAAAVLEVSGARR